MFYSRDLIQSSDHHFDASFGRVLHAWHLNTVISTSSLHINTTSRFSCCGKPSMSFSPEREGEIPGHRQAPPRREHYQEQQRQQPPRAGQEEKQAQQRQQQQEIQERQQQEETWPHPQHHLEPHQYYQLHHQQQAQHQKQQQQQLPRLQALSDTLQPHLESTAPFPSPHERQDGFVMHSHEYSVERSSANDVLGTEQDRVIYEQEMSLSKLARELLKTQSRLMEAEGKK